MGTDWRLRLVDHPLTVRVLRLDSWRREDRAAALAEERQANEEASWRVLNAYSQLAREVDEIRWPA